MHHAVGWVAAFLSGGVWGVAFFSWGLPLPMPVRIVGTVLIVVVFAAGSRQGTLAAGAFMLGMGASSLVLVVFSGLLFTDGWGLVPVAALLAGVGLHAFALPRGGDEVESSS